ncbi:hypothetical protein HPB50_016844 [Hyalomma asiaticum]|uniref:Uncharacterized protein n=1 Tax=Hyalomma asiaticum TaxID=266040 RepID=A0ACB7S5N4_HYAAI|nr:hypothetical protein HPB50_016844 [Hyalomma asiaticum]
MSSAKDIAPAATVTRSDQQKPNDPQSEPASPTLSAEGTAPSTAATTAVKGSVNVESPTAPPIAAGSSSTTEKEPQDQQEKEENKESCPPEVPSAALQQANQPTAATKIQVAAAQPEVKPQATAKRKVRRQPSTHPQSGANKGTPGSSPKFAGSPARASGRADGAKGSTKRHRRPTGVGTPSPLPSPSRVTAAEREAQAGSGPPSPMTMSCDITPPARVDPPSMAPSPARSTTNLGKQSDNQADVRDKSPSHQSPRRRSLIAAELVASYEKLHDLVQSRSQDTIITKTPLTRSLSDLRSLRKSPVPGNSVRITIAVTVCLCVVFFGAFLYLVKRRPAVPLKLCSTDDCQHHAALLTDQLNTTIDPCDDFEAFVCSAWQVSKDHREQDRSVMDNLRYAWYRRLEDTLTTGSLKYFTGRKPLAMYQMCNLYFPSNASQVQLIHKFFADHGLRWPEPPAVLQSPLALLVMLSYRWASPYWITVYHLNPPSSRRQRVLITPGLYISILRNQYHSVASAYGRYWQQFLELFYPDPKTRPTMKAEVVEGVRAMEEDVLESLHAAMESHRKRPAIFPFDKIDAHVPNTSAVEWVEAFQAGMSLEPSLTLEDEIVTDVAFLEVVGALLGKYGKLKLNQHLAWLMLQNFAPVTDYALLVGYFGSKEKAAAYRPFYCAHKVEATYKVLVLALGVVARLTDVDRSAIDGGFKSIVSAAFGKIRNSFWMNDQDKVSIITKLASTSMDFWPPEAILNDSELERLYEEFPEKGSSFADYWIASLAAMDRMNRTAEYAKALLLPSNNFPVYAGYGYITNTVRLAIGAAVAPAYYGNGTKGMLYGGLLFLMAMQMVKAFDDQGIRWYTNETALKDTFLSNTSLKAFRERTECEYGADKGSTFPEVPAIEISYAALKESHLLYKTEPLALSEQLPEDKVFFMTLCYMMCGSMRLRHGVTMDCNKAVRNFDPFARVYACKKGSKMNPEKKCSFFG